jgi:hypothetical protein
MESWRKGWAIWAVLGVSGCVAATARGPAPTQGVSAEAIAAVEEEAAPPPVQATPQAEHLIQAEVGHSAVADQAVLAHLPAGDAQWQALCGRGHDDVVSERLCKSRGVRSLAELQAALGIGFVSKIGNGDFGNPAFAFLSHSTSLTGRSVSPINPRVFVFTDPSTRGPIAGPPKPTEDFVALGFARGEPLVELVARDRTTNELRFFLVRFELGCEREQGGCSSWDLFGPSVEGGWVGLSVYDDADLENTVFDCNVCHQPNGPSTRKLLRMSQQRFPWTHFFRDKDQGKELVDEYFLAHDKREVYGGVPGQLVSWSEPARLEGLVEHEGFIEQPGELPTKALVQRIVAGKPLAGEPTYAAFFAAAQAGRGVTMPFPDARFVEKERYKLASATYRKTLAGTLDVEAFPSIAELHSDEARWRTGRRPAPDADGKGIVVQMCARCHNGSLDPSLSRARFDATALDTMDEAELALAIERMKLPSGSPLKMPPERFGELTEEEIAKAEAALLVQ